MMVTTHNRISAFICVHLRQYLTRIFSRLYVSRPHVLPLTLQ